MVGGGERVLRGFDRPAHAFTDRNLVRTQQLDHLGRVGPGPPGLAVLHEDRLLAEYFAGHLAVFLCGYGLRPAEVDDLGPHLGDTGCGDGLFDVVVLIQGRMDVAHARIDAHRLAAGDLVDALRHAAAPRAVKGEDP